MSRDELTPQEKRLLTINERYGSVSNMLKKRDVRDLILGGYNGGIKRGRKGTAAWPEGKLDALVKSRTRDGKGRFLPKDATEADVHSQATPE